MTRKLKLKNSKGFSLTELLVATLILMMLTMVISGGVSLALREYQRSVFISESNVLSTTINVSLSDMLRYARKVGENANGEVIFTNTAYAVNSGHFDTEKGQILYGASKTDYRSLVNSGAYTSIEVAANSFDMDYDPTTCVFYGSYTLQSKEVSGLAQDYHFTVKSVLMELKPT